MSPAAPKLDRVTLLALLDASRALIGQLGLGEAFQQIAAEAAAVLDAEASSVLLFDPQRVELVFQAATGPKGMQLVGERFDARLGIAGQAVRTRRALRVDDVRRNKHFFAGIDQKTHLQTRSLLAAPLIHRDQVLGVVEVMNPRGRSAFTTSDLQLLQVFANLAAAAASSARAFDSVSREARALRELQPTRPIVGTSAAIRQALDMCHKVAPSTATVLLTGETGTGKELAAHVIHERSPRHDRPFVAVNCAALPETLLESELFGHERGAFTGATDQKLGRFELAEGGTLLLDEIAEVSPAIQVKLLRVLQERQYVRVGGTKTLLADVRIIAATNRDLQQEMRAGRFRSDLYYRLNVFPIPMPPLRDRLEDLPQLVSHLVAKLVPSLGVESPTISDEAMTCLLSYHWPGNIRELRNVVERGALLAAGGPMTPQHLPQEIAAFCTPTPAPAPGSGNPGSANSAPGSGTGGTGSAGGGGTAGNPTFAGAVTLSGAGRPAASSSASTLANHERALLLGALRDCQWNQSAAARKLNISRDLLRYRVRKHRLLRSEVG